MADPIEIITTAVSLSKAIYGIVKDIQDAPDGLRSLERAVLQIQPILEHLVETLSWRWEDEQRQRAQYQLDGDSADKLQGLCDEARGFVEVAMRFLDQVAVKTANGAYKVRKTQWLRRGAAGSLKELENKFRTLCVSISTFFS